ncbi:hypothetical protein NBRC10512_005209 [Rhodotorula toruloides]|uniref:Proteophosphoglycan ppg4 n=1 Tax=Rhodotorula toruloides (strain NP11) TaxID=1130832 RepID=M7WJ87_RHOT1|nr:uncharacterized protein RHTO_07062 [Rhodotorula toruloides NP11]EMS18081.1 hypothetical protein RHTO_07062 [Rhodotorula toruloides NP11]
MAEHPSRKRERSSSSPSLPTSRNERPTPRSPPPIRPLPSQHVSPEALAFLEHYRDCSTSIIATYQKSLYEQYWMRENGAITDGVLHLAYAPDSPPKKAAPKHPDIVRAEYERISATIDWMVGERGSYGAALVVYGQPGCGKSRFLRIERARLFEDGRPCIVTTTERSTFDLYCDAGAFFDIPLKELEALDLLIPTIALVDAAEGVGVTDLQHAFVHDFIPNVVVVFATSPRVRRWQKLSSRLVPTLYWTIEGWPDNEIDALQKLVVLQPRSVWTNSPRVSLRQADRRTASSAVHLPPQIKDHHYHLPAGIPSANPLYSLPEAVYLLGRTVRNPLGAVARSPRPKSCPPEWRLEDLFTGLPHFNSVFSSLAQVNLLSGLPDAPEADVQAAEDLAKLTDEMRIKEDDQQNGFHQVFAEVPTPDVARPSLQYPRSIIVPASAPLERLARAKLQEFTLDDLARHARSFIHHPVVYGITHEVYAARIMELCGALAVLADGSTFSIPRLSRVSIVLPLVKTTANIDEDDAKVAEAVAKFDYDGLSHQKPAFPLDESFASTGSTLPRLASGLYIPQAGFPTLEGVAIYYDEDEQLIVSALQMTVSGRHDLKLSGIQSLYIALGPYAKLAKFRFAFVVPAVDKGLALIKPARAALPPPASLERSRRSTRSDAPSPFTWSRAFIVIDPKKPVHHVEAADN